MRVLSSMRLAVLVLITATLALIAEQRHEIRDRNRQRVGTITTLPNGHKEARDSHRRLLGRYDPKANETRDEHRRLVSRGDSLSALIWNSQDSSWQKKTTREPAKKAHFSSGTRR